MIKIGFSTTAGILSRVVRWFTKSKCSHSFIQFDWLGQTFILQADWNGVVFLPLQRFLSAGNQIVEAVEMPHLNLDDMVPVLAKADSAYDYTGLFGTGISIIGHWFKKKWSNPWDNPKAFFCSELIVLWLQDIHYPGAEILLAKDTAPEDLRLFLASKSDTI